MCASTLRMALRTAFPLWLPRLSRMTTSPGCRGRDQRLLDPCAETFTVDRAVEQAWRIHTVAAQRGKEGVGVPNAHAAPCRSTAFLCRSIPGAVPCWSWSTSHRQRPDGRDRCFVDMTSPTGAAAGDLRPVLPPGRTRFFLKLNPSACRKRRIDSAFNSMPCSARASRSSRTGWSGRAATSRCTRARCGSRLWRLCPPYLPGATLPVFRYLWPHLTTVETARSNRDATARQLSPVSSAEITRSRRSRE